VEACAVLGINPDSVTAPLLDLGCGEEAQLVHHLRRVGVAAFGLDAFAPEGVPFLVRGDWLTAPLERRRWGTVVSHMAFSLHFFHHHLADHPVRAMYARRYMDILAALAPGGRFVYSPGLPFLEGLLPREQYRIRRRPVEGLSTPVGSTAIARLAIQGTLCVTEVRLLDHS
jgi:SAM-dependent methyltransferase